MSALYDELVKLDKPIADRWKARLRGDPKRTLGPMDADAILKPLMQPDRTISDSETRAIAKMVTWGEWTPEALAVIRVIVRVGVEDGMFQNGGEIFVSPEKLRPVSSALGAGMTGKIAFKSPGTNFSYVPGHYQAIQKLHQPVQDRRARDPPVRPRDHRADNDRGRISQRREPPLHLRRKDAARDRDDDRA